MPPKKEYNFKHIEDNFVITISAYSFEGAYLRFLKTVKNPTDFIYVEK